MTVQTNVMHKNYFPAFFILHSYNQCSGFIKFQQVIRVAVLFYAPILVCYFGMIRFGVSTEKTSLILLSVTFIVLFFGAFQKLISYIPLIGVFVDFPVLTGICAVVIAIFVRKVLKSREINSGIYRLFGIIVIVLFAFEIGAFVINNSNLKKTKNLIYPGKPLSDHYISQNRPDSSKPDIYFLVFDAYTNNATLKTVWDYDNTCR